MEAQMKIKDEVTGRFIQTQTTTQKFLEKIDVDKTSHCWTWTAQKDKDGYGTMMVNINHKQKRMRAHRLSWQLYNHKEVPKGLLVLHHCDNPSCVNPDHLFLGTAKDNTQDMVKKGRKGYNNIGGERHPKARLDNEKVIQIRELYATKKYTQKELGKIFKVGGRQIGYIVNNQSWRNIE